METGIIVSRRDSLRLGLLTGASALLPAAARAANVRGGSVPSTPVRWIDDVAPLLSLGQTFGVPWPQGALR
ncbi:MAG: hypothetical protein ACLGIM_00940, partial [Alphaproteobacteria bacterium]